MTEILLEYCVVCYKERCKIINAEYQNAFENHTRAQAYELYLDLKANTWKLQHKNMHLLSRSRECFMHGTIVNVNEWIQSINEAIARRNRQTLEVASDIRDFFPTTKPIPRPKTRLIIAFKETLRKKTSEIRSQTQKILCIHFLVSIIRLIVVFVSTRVKKIIYLNLW